MVIRKRLGIAPLLIILLLASSRAALCDESPALTQPDGRSASRDRALGDLDPKTREAVETILAQEPAVKIEGSWKYPRREAASALITASATPALPILIDFVTSGECTSNEHAGTVVRIVSEIGDRSEVPFLLDRFDSSLPSGWESPAKGLKRIAPELLGKRIVENMENGTHPWVNSRAFLFLGDKSLLPRVVPLLDHNDAEVRKAAAHVFRSMPHEDAIPGLRRILDRPSDMGAHGFAVLALHRLGRDEGLEILVRDLTRHWGGTNPHTTGEAIAALAGPGGVEVYRPLLFHEDWFVRRQALVGMQWLLKDGGSHSPGRPGSRFPLVSVPDYLDAVYPLIFDENERVAQEARSAFEAGINAGASANTIGENLALAISHALWTQLFSEPGQQERYLGEKRYPDPPCHVLFRYRSRDQREEMIHVECTRDGEIRLVEGPPDADPESGEIIVGFTFDVSICGDYAVVGSGGWSTEPEFLLRQEGATWRLEAFLRWDVICVW